MKNVLKTLPLLALTFAVSCKKETSATNTGKAAPVKEVVQVSQDTLDFEVIALTPTKDTLWHVIVDNLNIEGFSGGDGKSKNEPNSYMTNSGTYVLEKGTGLPYAAGGGAVVAWRPVPLTLKK